MSGFDTWESYFYPETYDPNTRQGVLRNLLDERDADILRVVDSLWSLERADELLVGAAAVPQTFDGAHLQAIHQHLFQDIYPWAGQYRGVQIAKSWGGRFADASTGEIDRQLGQTHELVASTPWAELGHQGFASRLGEVFAHLNHAHPFREGNGRTAKQFLHDAARLSRFELEFDRVSPETWNALSEDSRPLRGSNEPRYLAARHLMSLVVVDRPVIPAGPDEDLSMIVGVGYEPLGSAQVDASHYGEAQHNKRQQGYGR